MVGAPYYTCRRLVAIAADHWQAIDGEASCNGVDLWALPPQSWFNTIWYWAIQRVKDPDRFNFELERPPPGHTQVVTEGDLEQDGASFMAFAAAMGAAPAIRQGTLPASEGVPSPDSSSARSDTGGS